MRIRILFTGRSYQTDDQLPSELEVPEDTTVSQALRLLDDALPGDQQLPPSCLVAVSGEHIGTVGQLNDQSLRDGQELVLIAPVAGG
jgi:molybdopterin converting factor small subunit